VPDTCIQILESLRSLGVIVQAVGPDRLRLEPASKIPQEMVPRIREAKPAILKALRNRPATCSPDCYEVQPGAWIHRPWAGCTTTTQPETARRHVMVTCWHCHEEKVCGCITCWQPVSGEQSQCAVCKGSGQVWRWIQ